MFQLQENWATLDLSSGHLQETASEAGSGAPAGKI